MERRHEQNRRFQEQSASELAQQYEERYRSQTGYRPGRGGMSYQPELMPDEVQQQSLIPGVNDPGESSRPPKRILYLIIMVSWTFLNVYCTMVYDVRL